MPTAQTAHFGAVSYAEDSTLEFPAGLPSFEQERSFLLLRPAAYEPLCILQSLATPGLAFLAIDVRHIAVNYRAELDDEAAALLGGAANEAEFDLLALVAVAGDGGVSVNLRAPIAVHRPARRAVQCIQSNPAYSCRHPLGGPPVDFEEPLPGGSSCS
ncbi:MAG: flagellar assembly protein FliW [Bryobacterales bacterium]|nr:flagellar assembly protein FliW [Bryobacterales bacterium]